jgi:hypothetical protein
MFIQSPQQLLKGEMLVMNLYCMDISYFGMVVGNDKRYKVIDIYTPDGVYKLGYETLMDAEQGIFARICYN